ncbi:MAG: HypC/HybG/HupF family hydrogenase formation chaperone [bacterium]|nr:HypC/HybG/HupF family hydrogenase formation chaperone [bacterium]
MCLGIPVEVVKINDEETALIELTGVQKEINIQLVPQVKIGDWVILHAGFAIEIIDEKEAEKTLDSFRELMEASKSATKKRN